MAVGLNPHDARCRDWGLIIADMLPYVLGKDVVGKVVGLGQGVTGFQVGDRVMSLADAAPGATQSGLQEFAVADIVTCVKIPHNMSDDEAVRHLVTLAMKNVGGDKNWRKKDADI